MLESKDMFDQLLMEEKEDSYSKGGKVNETSCLLRDNEYSNKYNSFCAMIESSSKKNKKRKKKKKNKKKGKGRNID